MQFQRQNSPVCVTSILVVPSFLNLLVFHRYISGSWQFALFSSLLATEIHLTMWLSWDHSCPCVWCSLQYSAHLSLPWLAMLASLVSADLNPSHCVNAQSTAGEDARKAFLPTCSSSFLFRLAAMEWCPVRQYDQDRDSHWYSVSMQFIWRACIHISSGNQHLIHNCVGGMFTVDSSQALPSGCKLRPRRIQMDHFPLASQTHNSVEWELLLYSWEEQMPGSIFLAILRFASPPIVLAISRSC